jgi:hypothetical protein
MFGPIVVDGTIDSEHALFVRSVQRHDDIDASLSDHDMKVVLGLGGYQVDTRLPRSEISFEELSWCQHDGPRRRRSGLRQQGDISPFRYFPIRLGLGRLPTANEQRHQDRGEAARNDLRA